MGDVLSAAARSAVMARVRSKGNLSTEMRLLKLLRAAKIKGWRRHLPLAGTPDFAFPREKVALFVDGCFFAWLPELLPEALIEHRLLGR